MRLVGRRHPPGPDRDTGGHKQGYVDRDADGDEHGYADSDTYEGGQAMRESGVAFVGPKRVA